MQWQSTCSGEIGDSPHSVHADTLFAALAHVAYASASPDSGVRYSVGAAG